MNVPIRVLIADDQALLRAGFRMILESEPGMEVVAECGDGAAAVELARLHRPQVALMDIRMPVLDGIRATRAIVAEKIPTRVLILTTYDLDEYVYDALEAGASGFLLKDAPPENLIAGIRIVAAGDALLAPSITRRLIEELTRSRGRPEAPPAALGTLTERELEVLMLIAAGLSNREMAERLFLGEATVKTHVGRILNKLELRDRVQAVVLAYEAGLVRPGQR